MADLGTVFVTVKMKTDEFDRDVDKTKKKTEGVTKSTDGLQKGYGILALKIGAAVVAFKKIIAALGESIQLYGRQIQAERRLQSALELSGREADRLYPKYVDLAGEIQTLTTVGDEAAIELLGFATSLEIAEDKIEEAVKGAIGLNEVFGIGTEQALRGVANAFQGNFSQLERYIPALRNATTEGEKLAILQKTLGSSFDVAKGQAETAFGALEQYENAAGDLKEELGRVVVEGAEPFVRALTNFALRTTAALSEARKFRDMMTEWAETGEITTTTLKDLETSLRDAQREMGALEGLTTGDQERAEELEEFIRVLEDRIKLTREMEALDNSAMRLTDVQRARHALLTEAIAENAKSLETFNKIKEDALSEDEKRLRFLDTEISRMGTLRNTYKAAGIAHQELQDLINNYITERSTLLESMKEEEEIIPRIQTAWKFAHEEALEDLEDLVETYETYTQKIKDLEDQYVEFAQTISGFASPVMESFGEALSGVEDGWVNLGKTAVMAVAAILQALAREALVRGAKALASPATAYQAPAWFSAATLATVGAGIIKGLASQITSAALGTDFITSGPQLLAVGDNPGGRERVTVEPLSSRNVNGPQSMGGDVYLDGAKVGKWLQKSAGSGQILIPKRAVV